MSYSSVKKYMLMKLGDAPVTGTDHTIRFRGDPVFAYDNNKDDDTDTVRADGGKDYSIAGIKSAKLPYEYYLYDSGANDTPPSFGKMLQNAGSVETVYAGTGVGYYFKSAGWYNYGAAAWGELEEDSSPDAITHNIDKAVSSLSIACAGVGQKVVCSGEMQGRYTGTSAVLNANIPARDFPDGTAISFVNSPVLIGGVAVCGQSFTVDVGNSIEAHQCSSDSTGIFNFRITKQDPKITLTIAKTALSTYNPTANFCGTATSVEIQLPNISIYAPKAQLTGWTNTNVNSVSCWQLEFKLLPNDGEDVGLDNSTFLEILKGATA